MGHGSQVVAGNPPALVSVDMTKEVKADRDHRAFLRDVIRGGGEFGKFRRVFLVL